MPYLGVVRRLTPPALRQWYHRGLASAAAARYRHPSRSMLVVGVTGTDGKTTTATLLAAMFQAAGWRVGLSSTVYFQIGEKRWRNETHMTMPGRFALQRMLRSMVDAGCRVAVIEASSEGLVQHRLDGVDVDAAVLTNISPEHLESHGGWERYRAAKALLFARLARSRKKMIDGRPLPKVSVVNYDDPSFDYFSQAVADIHVATSIADNPEHRPGSGRFLAAQHIVSTGQGSRFTADGQDFHTALPGTYNVANALQAIAVCTAYGVSPAVASVGLAIVRSLPGRHEEIATNRGWRVVVDYALTPAALEQLYTTLRREGARRVVAVFGAAGGGRDAWKRPELGRITGRLADDIILTTDDPYDEDPLAIAQAIRSGVAEERQDRVRIVIDRRAAIRAALDGAENGDIIAVTGMGAQTTMQVARGRSVPWDDAQTIREELQKMLATS